MKCLKLLLIVVLLGVLAPLPALADLELNLSIDNTGPVVSAASIASLTDTTAKIDWFTNVPADSLVEYGTTLSYGLATTLDPTLTTTHSVTITGLQVGTTYHFRISSADSSGVFNPSEDNTFTTIGSQVPPSSGGGSSGGGSSSSGSGSSGGSSGGGSVGSIKTSVTNSLQLDSATLTATTQPSTLVKTDVPKQFPVTSFSLRSRYRIVTSITIQNIESPNVPLPSEHVYEYMKLDGNTTNIDYIQLDFQINRSWLDAYNFETKDVKMVRFANNEWQRLDTYYINSDGDVYSFQATTPGFSIFAIIAEKSSSAPAPENTTNISPIVSPLSDYPVNIQYFILAIVMVMVAILIFLYEKRYKRKKEYNEPVPSYFTSQPQQ